MNFILMYKPDGPSEGVHHKIKAIKAVRVVFGLGLKEAKGVVERTGTYEFGIICTNLQRMAVCGEYVACFEQDGIPHADDFHFESIPEAMFREDFTKRLPIVPQRYVYD